MDNILVERLWRGGIYEEEHLNDYQNVLQAAYGLGKYFRFYNGERLHKSLGTKPRRLFTGCPLENETFPIELSKVCTVALLRSR